MHRYKVREIAQQSGLSEATVDRVLNNRQGVRESTRAEVRQAIADLDRQRTQLRLEGRKFLLDMVMQSPQRFSSALRTAVEAELPTLRPAVLRCRFHFRETGGAEATIDTLDRIAAKGSHGVVLKAPDTPEVVAAIDRLAASGIPVVTLFTDVARSQRVGYVGMDDRAAGATAAYLLAQWLGERPGNILVSLSRNYFRNEEERETGFRATLSRLQPWRQLVELPDSDGLDETVRSLALTALTRDSGIVGAYSIGGGNTALVEAFAASGRRCEVFIAHDLDADNIALLRGGHVSAVLHHDLHSDVRLACQLLMAAHGALGPVRVTPSQIQIATPHNVPGYTQPQRG